MSRSLDTRLFSFETISMSMHPIWPGNLLRHGPVSLVVAILLICQLSAPAQARTESQAAPGPGKVVVRGPWRERGPGSTGFTPKAGSDPLQPGKGHPAHDLTDQGIRAAFRSNTLFEVQALHRIPGFRPVFPSRPRRGRGRLPAPQVLGIKIDAVIAVYPSAVEFLLANKRAPFHGVPIIACVITPSFAESLEHSPVRRLITGQIAGVNAGSVLDDALRLRPGTKRVALVAGTTPTDGYNAQLFHEALKRYTGRLDLIDLTGLPMREILARAGSLPPDAIVLYATLFKDGAGQSFVPRDALSLIARAANAPVFGLFDSYMGSGIVGGPLTSLEGAGKAAADLALRVMAGESPGNIPFTSQGTYAYLYDWRELKRWGIKEKSLPPGSIVQYKEFSVWDLYAMVYHRRNPFHNPRDNRCGLFSRCYQETETCRR